MKLPSIRRTTEPRLVHPSVAIMCREEAVSRLDYTPRIIIIYVNFPKVNKLFKTLAITVDSQNASHLLLNSTVLIYSLETNINVSSEQEDNADAITKVSYGNMPRGGRD
jgi:hypothetical protein